MEQLSIFNEETERTSESCYQCTHFAEFKEPRMFTNRDGEFGVFGICFKSFCKNGSYATYPIYIADGKCKDFKRRRVV
jgi:hypothetical protein